MIMSILYHINDEDIHAKDIILQLILKSKKKINNTAIKSNAKKFLINN